MTAKRALDLLLLIIFFPFLLPLGAVATILVWIFLGRPILYTQTRPGFHAKPFTMYKFRSMLPDRSGRSDAERLTRFGKILRRSSLDELPELWNVLRGEMSLVGPRPLLMEYLPLYTAEQARRHDVPPGITGWAQINGRNGISWEEKFKYDIWYVDNRSLLLDLKIVWLTVVRVLSGTGVSQVGHVTVEKFRGSGHE